jgi:Papain family cysteine protease
VPTLQCGCCWTFATTGITECINAMYTGEVVSVSEQQLIDCDTAKPYEDAGCEGGDFTGSCIRISLYMSLPVFDAAGWL